MILEREKKAGREGDRERERNIDGTQKHKSVALHTHPNRGSNPQPFGVWDDALTN